MEVSMNAFVTQHDVLAMIADYTKNATSDMATK